MIEEVDIDGDFFNLLFRKYGYDYLKTEKFFKSISLHNFSFRKM